MAATIVAPAYGDLYMQRGSAVADTEQIIANRLHVSEPRVDDQTAVACRRASRASFRCRWIFDGDSVEWVGHGYVRNVPGESALGAPWVRYDFRGLHRWYVQHRHGVTFHHRVFRWLSRGTFIYAP